MIRRTFSLANRGGFGEDYEGDEPNPMESVANLSDVMLVLAVALMVAIVAHWNVDVTKSVQIDESNLTAIDADVSEQSAQSADGSTEYEEVGTVYKNVETGEMYVVSG